MIRPYLRDLINNHKSQEELNNEASDSDTERGEWKVQPAIQNNCISTKDFKEIHTIYSASKPVETLMGSDTDDAIDRFFDTTLQRFQQSIETSNDRGSESTHEIVVLLYQYFQKIDIRIAESYKKFSDWLVNKGSIINPRNKNNYKRFQYAITVALNYNNIKKKYLQKILIRLIQIFHLTKRRI